MKTLLTTGMILASLTIFGVPLTEFPVKKTVPEPAKYGTFDGFTPHEQVTSPPVCDTVEGHVFLDDFGSEAYL